MLEIKEKRRLFAVYLRAKTNPGPRKVNELNGKVSLRSVWEASYPKKVAQEDLQTLKSDLNIILGRLKTNAHTVAPVLLVEFALSQFHGDIAN